MHRLGRALRIVENVVAGGALAGAAVIAIVAVVLRYAFNILIFWSEEAVIYLVLLSVFVGAVVTLRHDEHVKVDLVPNLLQGRAQLAWQVMASLLTVVYLLCIGVYAWLLIFEPSTRNTVTPALKLPLWVVYLAVPIGFTLMFLRMLEVLYRQVTGRVAYPEAAKSVLEAEAEGIGMHIDPSLGTDPRTPGTSGGTRP
ncbi:MAG: TRAP transporter small permease [Actinomycetota bacterium]|nr:TRAP transporter small permease [Actinomycetota bacterium]